MPFALAMCMWWSPAAAQSDVARCRVLGRVIDADLGNAIAGASVWLESEGGLDFLAGTTTSSDGSFAIDVRSCGAAELRTRMIGYLDGFELVAFVGDGQIHQTTVRLERSPLEVEELRVEVPSSLRLREVGFYARKAWEAATGRDYGDFYDPDEVVGRSDFYGSVGKMALAARIRGMYPPHSLCRGPSFYVDGRRFKRRFNFIDWLDHSVKLGDVEGIEVYRPVWAAIPDEFREPNSSTCGAVLIWTKSGGGGGAPQIEVELCEPTSDLGSVQLDGIVTDRFTGVRLPAAYVTLVAADADAGFRELHTISDGEGRFRYCDILLAPVSIRARYGDAASAVQRVAESARASKALNLRVPITPPG